MNDNVLVFFCDQLQAKILSCYGGTTVRTPNIDALAAESAIFDQAYTPTATCSPARASLMTGLYPHTHHMFNNSTPGYSYCCHLKPDTKMICDWAAETGACETAYYGKWHIGPAEDLFNSRFDHTIAEDADKYPFGPTSHWHPNTSLGELVEPMLAGTAGLIDCKLEDFPDVVAASYSCDFIRKCNRDKNFMLYCAFPGPHSPWMLPQEWGIRHDPDSIELPRNRADTFANKPINQRKLRLQFEVEGGMGRQGNDDQAMREGIACMYSYMELIDAQVGRVIDTLKEEGLYNNTWIIFTADHGDMAGAHGFLSKGIYMYDEIYRIPLIVRPPAGAGGKHYTREAVTLMDVTTTCMHAVSGMEPTDMLGQQLHGQSLVLLLRDGREWERTHHYAEYHGDWYAHYSARMVTDGEWKLVWNLSDYCELYNMVEDPDELTNRFDDPSCEDIKMYLMKKLQEEAKRLGDGQVRLFAAEVESRDDLYARGPLNFDN